MGITTSFVNKITTNGVLTADAITNTSIGNITSIAGTGSMKLISQATASGSATIDFTLGDYKEYQFYFVNMHPATDNTDFMFNVSIDNGSNYNVTKTTTMFYAYHNEAGTDNAFGYDSSNDLAQSTGYQIIGNNNGNASDESLAGDLTLYNPSSAVYVKHFICNNAYTHQNNAQVQRKLAGYANTTSALTNIRFQMSSGNIDSGTILMYGIN
jgi:hypothetical protein